MTNAVVDPRTMVVHLEDTNVAFTAVMCPCWLPCLLTLATLVTTLQLCLLLTQFCRFTEHKVAALLDSSWVCTGRSKKGNTGECAEAIESEKEKETHGCQGEPREWLKLDDSLPVPVENADPITDVLAKQDQQEYLRERVHAW